MLFFSLLSWWHTLGAWNPNTTDAYTVQYCAEIFDKAMLKSKESCIFSTGNKIYKEQNKTQPNKTKKKGSNLVSFQNAQSKEHFRPYISTGKFFLSIMETSHFLFFLQTIPTGQYSCFCLKSGALWHIIPAKCIGPARPINWFLLCTDELICMWDQKINARREIRDSAFIPWLYTSRYVKQSI